MFLPIICWKTFEAKNLKHTQNLVNAGFKGLRIFLNIADFPQGQPSQNYIANIMNNKDGMHAWTFEDFPKPFWSGPTNEKVKDAFDLCKRLNWLPIITVGYSEEQTNWIHRAPQQEYWTWLAEFAKQLGIYMRDTYQFPRCDIEIYNEPNKLISFGFGWDKYSQLALLMVKAWKSVSINYKAHIFGCDLQQQGYLDGLLRNVDLLNNVDYIATHALYHAEWDDNLIDKVNQKIAKYPHLKQVLTEMTPMGNWSRMNKLIGKVDMYGPVLAIRNNTIGTAFEIDDIFIYEFNNTNNINCTSATKRDFLKYFNAKYYKPYILQEIDDDMKLDKLYKLNSHGIGVKFIQKVINVELMLEPLLIEDGIWGAKTTIAVKDYQKLNGLVQDGLVGEKTFKSMIDGYPDIWNQIEYSYATGER